MTSLATLLLLACAAPQQTLHVDAALTTGANDGTSWADAFQGPLGLRQAVDSAPAGARIFVTGGLYRAQTTGRDGVIVQRDVSIYGGFAGGESGPEGRPAIGVERTILSGDGDGDGPYPSGNHNALHVVRTAGTGLELLLDRLEIADGQAEDGPSSDLDGAGLQVRGGDRVVVRDCVIRANEAEERGGGAEVLGAAEFLRCTFQGNVARFGAGLVFECHDDVLVDCCEFSGNRGLIGVAILATTFTSSPQGRGSIRQCVVYGNSVSLGSGSIVAIAGSTPVDFIHNTVVSNTVGVGGHGGGSGFGVTHGGTPGTCVAAGNLVVDNGTGAPGGALAGYQFEGLRCEGCYTYPDFDTQLQRPVFVDEAARDYRLVPGSPGADAGDNRFLPADVLRDRAGQPRLRDDPAVDGDPQLLDGRVAHADAGAFETQVGPVGRPYCPATLNSTGTVGRLSATGSVTVPVSGLVLTASDLPPNQFGLLAVGQSPDLVPLAGGLFGYLCIGGTLGRFNGQIASSGPMGRIDVQVDLTAIPSAAGPMAAAAGDRLYFQLWHRDALGTIAISNLTEALQVQIF